MELEENVSIRDKDEVIWMSVTNLYKICHLLSFLHLYFLILIHFLTPFPWADRKADLSFFLKDALFPGLYHNFNILHGASARRGIYTVTTVSSLSCFHGPSNSRRSLLLLYQCSAWGSFLDHLCFIYLDDARAISLWLLSFSAFSLTVLADSRMPVSKLWTLQIAFSFQLSKRISV